MNQKELFGLVSHRYGLAIGLRIAKQVRDKAIREHENTQRIRKARQAKQALERQLLFRDQTKEQRESLRTELENLIVEEQGFRKIRDSDTKEVKDRARNYNMVVVYTDNKVEQLLEQQNLLQVVEPTEEEVKEASEWKKEQIKK